MANPAKLERLERLELSGALAISRGLSSDAGPAKIAKRTAQRCEMQMLAHPLLIDASVFVWPMASMHISMH